LLGETMSEEAMSKEAESEEAVSEEAESEEAGSEDESSLQSPAITMHHHRPPSSPFPQVHATKKRKHKTPKKKKAQSKRNISKKTNTRSGAIFWATSGSGRTPFLQQALQVSGRRQLKVPTRYQ
jgi:hypothetical protein